MRTHVCLAVALLAGVLAVYAPVRDHDFVDYDDTVVLAKIRPGLSFEGLRHAFASQIVGNWIPVTALSWLIGQEIHGEHAPGHLMGNVALHGAAALLLFAALVAMTGAAWPSAWVAGVFALHPLHVESVAWVSQRKDVLCGFFWMATLLAYVRAVQRPTRARRASVVAGTLLALLSKPMAVTLPFTLLLLDVWPLRRIPLDDPAQRGPALRTAILSKAPLFALAAMVSAITYLVQDATGAVSTAATLPFPVRAANAALALRDYLGDALWPAHLAAFYPHPRSVGSLVPVVGFGALLVLATLGLLRLRTRQPQLAVGWLWFLGTLVPVLGIVQVGEQARADRYTYVPLVGLAIALAFTLHAQGERRSALRPALAALGLASLIALGVGARAQVHHWRDSTALYRRAVAVTHDNAFAQRGLGRALQRDGDLAGAERHLLEALRLEPRRAATRLALAEIRFARDDTPGAIVHYRAALELDPADARTAANLGQLLVASGRLAEAREALEDALARSGDGRTLPRAYQRAIRLGLARIHLAAGDLPTARAQATAALALDPDAAAAHVVLADAAALEGDTRASREHARRALDVAEARGDSALAEALRQRLAKP